jgi:sugar O-acyltransferase (sialic acid O-acetyltransferase NeuD family)
MKKNIVIGSGGHSKVIIDILKRNNQKIYGIVSDDPLIKKNHTNKSNFLGKLKFLFKLKDKNSYNIYIGIGKSDIRKKIYFELKKYNFNFPPLICPTAILSNDCKIGKGSFINSGCILNTHCSVGLFSIINTGSTIDHETKIGNFSTICPGVNIAGQVKIGNNCFVGTGSVINNNLKLTSNLIVGSGSVVINSLLKSGTAVGIPCNYIKT